jgi:cytochrome c
MSTFFQSFCLIAFLAFAQNAIADDTPAVERASKEEAVAFVKKAVEYFKANGMEKALAEFNNPHGKFVDRDLYIFANDAKAICLASGAHNRLVGENRIEQQDTDGKFFMRERVELMQSHENFWQHYKYPDPLTHKILPKSQYCEVVIDPVRQKIAICAGVYDAQK